MTNHIASKMIKSLREKKYRTETKKFLVEGEKNVLELFGSDFKIEYVYATRDFIDNNSNEIPQDIKIQIVTDDELKSLGTLEHNDTALAVVFQKKAESPNLDKCVTLVLDDIRDPGNLGTLIRIADWYGIKNIICSTSCVDWYNPKVISATMGSFTRVNVYYTELSEFLLKQKMPVIGGFLEGKSVYDYSFPDSGFLVIGSESHGISKDVKKCIREKVTIPKIGFAESLNAAVSGAIILDRWLGK